MLEEEMPLISPYQYLRSYISSGFLESKLGRAKVVRRYISWSDRQRYKYIRTSLSNDTKGTTDTQWGETKVGIWDNKIRIPLTHRSG